MNKKANGISIRQKNTLLFLLCSLMLMNIYNVKEAYIIVIFSFLIIAMGIIFIPILGSKIDYSKYMHTIVYYFPMYIYILCTYKHLSFTLLNIGYAIIIGAILIIFNINEYSRTISKNNIQRVYFVSKKDLILCLFTSFVAVVSEEIYFRGFIMLMINTIDGILISSFLFLWAHYINRWAINFFSIKSYFYQFLVSMVLCSVYYKSKSLIIVIVAHLLFNSHEYILKILQYRCTRSNTNKIIFDDYKKIKRVSKK